VTALTVASRFPIFSPLFVFWFAVVLASVRSEIASKRTVEIVLRGAKGTLLVPGGKRMLLFEGILFGNLLTRVVLSLS